MKTIVLSTLVVVLVLAASRVEAADPVVAFGTRHGVALRSNGEVVTWGNNVGCQLGRRSGNVDANPGLVMRHVKEIAAAADHTLALTDEGKVYGWGTNGEAVLGTGDGYDKCEGPVLIASLVGKTVVHIATGYDFSVALTSNGDLYCTGDNAMGQCPVGKTFEVQSFTAVPLPALAGNVVAVKTGAFHTLALTRDGTLYAFGRGLDGQLGTGKNSTGAGAVVQLTDVASFSAGTWHSVALRKDGTIWAWGNNSRAQLCDGGTANRNVPGPIQLPGGARAAQVAAGSHATLVRTADGALFVCGDNNFGQLGLTTGPIVATPTLVAGAAATSPVLVAAGYVSAFSADGCSLRLAGENDSALISGAASQRSAGFVARPTLNLCAPRTTGAGPTGDIVNPAPSGGLSGCWGARKEEDASVSAKFAGLRQAMLGAEDLLKRNRDFMAALEPVRMRTSLAAGPYVESGARMHVKVVAERKQDGTRVWSTGCDVIPQIDRIGGAISQISIFFNAWQEEFIGSLAEPPTRTGTFGGYPEYNHWILITRDGRLPWIPKTLDDKLAEVAARRERALAEWKANANGMQLYPKQRAALEKQLDDVKAYRASFSPDELRAPGVWADKSGAGRKLLDSRIAALQTLSPGEQQEADALGRESRDLERRAQAETRNQNLEEAARLRARSNELALRVRSIRKDHLEAAAPLMADAQAEYDLTNIRPGVADQAISVKPDPAFVSSTDPNCIQVIAISFSEDPDPKKIDRRAWQQRVKESFDYAALAALLTR